MRSKTSFSLAAIVLSMAGVQLSPMAMVSAAPPPLPAAAQSERATIFIPFDPPVGERLVYRLERSVEGNGEPERSESFFAIRFDEQGDAFVMTVSSAAADGSPRETSETGAPRPPRRFRVSRDGDMMEMVDEEAAWAAIEDQLEQYLSRNADDADARGGLWAVRQMRELPFSQRMTHFAQHATPIIHFGGTTIDPGRSTEFEEARDSPFGPVTATSRTIVEGVAEDSLTITRVTVVPADQLQAAMDQLVERFGQRPYGIGSRLISGESRRHWVIDRRTGLARFFRFQDSTISEESGQRRSTLVTMTVERVS